MKQIQLILALLIIAASTMFSQNIEVRTDLKKYFDEYGH